MTGNTVVTDNPTQSRFEIHVDGTLAGIEDYTTSGDVLSFNHTEIYPEHEGLGLAAVLVGSALDQLRARGLKVHPVCPYVVKYLGKHPEYQDLVS
ncbi:GNAT family N-acetyltransferase [Rhodococcus sp. IEGM 1379]|uniref:GNAT family N-acetyltransferase n=1 Tax=Rhodococcus sp. IEGM 1379 TaxID=3047086 RepID=UPI0024B7BFEB|nr:GNAT family N-acetyltransferase [Rhodococcus sp. IEGM 1379]MDI9916443.1 GNAT family N-acetyltransferase [Rhodococcus sp. IEGM 1379]